MTASSSRWITTTEAAQRLGVKRATLYAYVSRGVLHSERRPGQQESLFDRAEIDALASSARPAGAPQPVLRFRSVATLVSSHAHGQLLYRGIPLSEVVRDHTFDSAAALVLGSTSADELSASSFVEPGLRSFLSATLRRLPVERRFSVAMQLQAAADPLAVDVQPERVRVATVTSVRSALRAFGADAGDADDVPWLLVSGLRGAAAGRADAELMRVLLICLLDHGLTASTIAARVAASTRAGIHDCLCAGYAAMSGLLHGAQPIAARALIDDPRPAKEAVAAAIRAQGEVPGFGHFLYPDGDPRADLVLATLWERRGTTRLRRRIDDLVAIVGAHSGARPNVDLAVAAVLRALDLPAVAGEVAYQTARSHGLAAHVMEEYAEQPLRWRGREAVG